MEFPFATKLDDYYRNFIQLQNKLRKSEEERYLLETKFNEMVQIVQEEERVHYRKLRSRYRQFLDEDRKRQARNERIVQNLERIETRINMLSAKTERVNMLRKHYRNSLTKIDNPLANTVRETSFQQYPLLQTPVMDKKKTEEEKETMKILDDYLQNVSSQKCKDLVADRQKKEEEENLDNYQQASTCNRSVAIADDIMNSIYSRHYNRADVAFRSPKEDFNMENKVETASSESVLKNPLIDDDDDDDNDNVENDEINLSNKPTEMMENGHEVNVINEISVQEKEEIGLVPEDSIAIDDNLSLLRQDADSEEAVELIEDINVDENADNLDVIQVAQSDNYCEESNEVNKSDQLDNDELDNKDAIIEEKAEILDGALQTVDEKPSLEDEPIENAENSHFVHDRTKQSNQDASEFDNANNYEYSTDPQQFYDQYDQQTMGYDQYSLFDQYGQLVQPQYDENGQIVPQYDETGQIIALYDQNGQQIVGDQVQYDEGVYDNQDQEDFQPYNEDEYNVEISKENEEDNVGAAIDDVEEEVENEEVKNIVDNNEELKANLEDESNEEQNKVAHLMEVLDTDAESSRQNTSKLSENDTDFDFS